jgi:hypothetical protein
MRPINCDDNQCAYQSRFPFETAHQAAYTGLSPIALRHNPHAPLLGDMLIMLKLGAPLADRQSPRALSPASEPAL